MELRALVERKTFIPIKIFHEIFVFIFLITHQRKLTGLNIIQRNIKVTHNYYFNIKDKK